MKILYLIPARGGSKGFPGKNIKELNGKALINHSIDFARKFTDDSNICVSTDSTEIIKCVETNNLKVHFKRPAELATDTASTIEVINHALDYYKSKGKLYDVLILLQPTTPFRRIDDLTNMINLWNNEIDMLVSVKESHDSPYFNLFEENSNGYLSKSKDSAATRRQDSPKVFSINGSIYVYNINSINSKSINNFTKIKKYIMNDPVLSIDIDTEFDFIIAKTLGKKLI
ncbi:acylneuraminate cytidylyltransferase family protein [Flavobacteriaceae bacterium]|nr:acylneuraminate cytidylyltransferase family protein [Flavobacteriaceae bacterium]